MLDVISSLRQISGIVAATVIKFGRQLSGKFIEEPLIRIYLTAL